MDIIFVKNHRLAFQVLNGYFSHIIKRMRMHGLSREDRGAFKQYSEKQSPLTITHHFICAIFFMSV